MVDVSIGQQKNRTTFRWATLNRIEQDAVLAAFVESDQRTQTNVIQNRLYGLWRVRSNVTAAYTYWFGRTLNRLFRMPPGQQEWRRARKMPGWTECSSI